MVAVLAVILCIFLPFTTSFAQIDNSLVLYLPFDEGTGDIAKDGSGNGNDGVLNGKPKWVEGKYGSALEFDGKTNYVEIPFSDTLNITKNLTISVWVKPRKNYVDEPPAWYYFVFKQGYIWEFGWQGWGDSVTFKLKPVGNPLVATSFKMSMTQGEWYHITGVKKGNSLAIYVNGEKCSFLGAFPGDLESRNTSITVNSKFLDDKHMGFAGVLDEVAIFSRALTEEEIQEVMKGVLKPQFVRTSGNLAAIWGGIKMGAD